MKESVGIMGCGWLGLPLGSSLARIGYPVIGSTTSVERLSVLQENGIAPYLFYLNPKGGSVSEEGFRETDYLVVSIPPRLAKQESGEYAKQIDQLVEILSASAVKGVVFISTTSVYPDLNRVVVEEDVQIPSDSLQPVLVEAENKMIGLRALGKHVTIARMSGLMGYDRIPGKYVRGKKSLETGSIKVNYIHRDDAIQAIRLLIENGCPNETYNLCAPQHPTRQEVYDSSCLEFRWEVPTYCTTEKEIDFKIIAADKFTQQFHYSYIYPNPLDFNYELPAITIG